jgi:threonyl-tRNA synthetase
MPPQPTKKTAASRDHRVLGAELKLFTFADEVGPGLPLWLPNGERIRRALTNFVEEELRKRGYEMVFTPHIARVKLYQTSGHWEHFRQDMFPPMQPLDEDSQKQELAYALKPMNCPHTVMLYKAWPRSFRDLPVRYAEFGTVYRYEQSGEISGIARVRSLTIDDAHIFCRPDQVKEEINQMLELAQHILYTTGLKDIETELSLRGKEKGQKYAGDSARWEEAEKALKEILEEQNIPHTTLPGEAAFYGPKIDLKARDALGRMWQLGTIQLDYVLPERFQLTYVASGGKEEQPVIIHRALLGSLERFISILIEQYGGAFPLWLAPVQVAVLPLTSRQHAAAKKVAQQLRTRGLYVEVDRRNVGVAKKVRDAEARKIPAMLVLGAKEERSGKIAVRLHGKGDRGTFPLSKVFQILAQTLESRAAKIDL